MNWVEVPAGKYKILQDKDKKSHCQLEIAVRSASSHDYIRRCLTDLIVDGTILSHIQPMALIRISRHYVS